MEQTVTRTALLICGMLAIGVLANLFMFQSYRPRLAMSSTDGWKRPARTGADIRRDGTTPRGSGIQLGAPRSAVTPGRQASAHRSKATDPEFTSSHVASPALVRAVQRELFAKGFLSRPPDGALDMATRAAIVDWEQENALALTADVSEELLKALLLGAGVLERPRNGVPGPAARMLVRHVQMLLKSRKASAVALSGAIDEQTKAAIVDFERAQGLPVSGRISSRLVARLENAGRHGR